MKRFTLAFVFGFALIVGCAGRTSRVATPADIETASVSEKASVEESAENYTTFTGPFRIAVAYDNKGTCNPEIRAEKSVEDLLTARGVPPYDVRAFARPDSSVCAFPYVAEGKVTVAYKGDLTPEKRAIVEETMSWLTPTPVVPAKPKTKSASKSKATTKLVKK
jgi:hypothetical protein